ncbi:MAG: SDR family oxidoreductase, partial [Anaerolineae bacterium]|nr:SDR family oxidoreductase [Anaerolineae bacterium]
ALVRPLGKVWETSPAAWSKLIAVNVLGPYLCSRAVLPHLLDKGQGRIINVSSGAADMDLEGASAYCASKAALERFSGTLAAEVRGSGVRVFTFRPGIVDTRMQADIRETPAHHFPKVERWQNWHERGQLRPPADPALAILWLASPFAADSEATTFSIDDSVFWQQFMEDLGIAEPTGA